MNIALEQLPSSLEQFKAMPELQMTRPEDTCAMLLCALQLYVQLPQEGLEAINLLRGPRPMTTYDTQFLWDRLRGKKYLPLAYFEGANPDNGYQPQLPYQLNVLPDPTGQKVGEGYLKVFLSTVGADSPRPITLRRKGEAWCLWEYSSILSGIQTPKADNQWT